MNEDGVQIQDKMDCTVCLDTINGVSSDSPLHHKAFGALFAAIYFNACHWI